MNKKNKKILIISALSIGIIILGILVYILLERSFSTIYNEGQVTANLVYVSSKNNKGTEFTEAEILFDNEYPGNIIFYPKDFSLVLDNGEEKVAVSTTLVLNNVSNGKTNCKVRFLAPVSQAERIKIKGQSLKIQDSKIDRTSSQPEHEVDEFDIDTLQYEQPNASGAMYKYKDKISAKYLEFLDDKTLVYNDGVSKNTAKYTFDTDAVKFTVNKKEYTFLETVVDGQQAFIDMSNDQEYIKIK